MGSAVPHCLRQVPHYPARQRCGGRGPAGGVLPQGTEDARSDQRKEVAADESVEESVNGAARHSEPVVSAEPAGLQSLPAQGKSGKTLGLPLSRGHAELSEEVDGPASVAAITLV